MNTELLQKYISGNATEAEKQHVTKWMQESPENMREYMAQRKLYDIALWRTAPIAEEKRQPKKIFSLRTLWIEAAKSQQYLQSFYWVHTFGSKNIL